MKGKDLCFALATSVAALMPAVGCLGTETGNPPSRSASCEDVVCAPCEPAITLTVVSSEGEGAIEGVSIDGNASVCSVVGEATQCWLGTPPYTSPGAHTLTVAAEGHASLSLEVEVTRQTKRDCCSCEYVPTQLKVTLTPAP